MKIKRTRGGRWNVTLEYITCKFHECEYDDEGYAIIPEDIRYTVGFRTPDGSIIDTSYHWIDDAETIASILDCPREWITDRNLNDLVGRRGTLTRITHQYGKNKPFVTYSAWTAADGF